MTRDELTRLASYVLRALLVVVVLFGVAALACFVVDGLYEVLTDSFEPPARSA